MYSLHSIKFLVSEKKYFYNFPIEFNAITLPYSGSHVEFSIDTQKKRHLSEKIRIFQNFFFSKLTLWQISSEMVTINIKKTLCLQEEIQTLSKSENMITLGLSHRDTRSYAQTLFWGGSLFDFQLAQKKNDIRQSTIQVYFKG